MAGELNDHHHRDESAVPTAADMSSMPATRKPRRDFSRATLDFHLRRRAAGSLPTGRRRSWLGNVLASDSALSRWATLQRPLYSSSLAVHSLTSPSLDAHAPRSAISTTLGRHGDKIKLRHMTARIRGAAQRGASTITRPALMIIRSTPDALS